MILLVIYLIGVVLSFTLYFRFGIRKGQISLSDLFVIFLASMISWFGVIIFLLIFVDFDSIIIWRRKKMKIETKYDIGQEVWCMFCGFPKKCAIVSITSRIYRKGNITDYTVDIRKGLQVEKLGSELFPTKEELLKSL